MLVYLKVQKPTWAGLLEFRSVLERRPWSILSWSSGIIALSFMAWYGLQLPLNPTIGAQFVLSEWPDPVISPYFHAKPITWFSYFSFLYWAFGLESHRNMFLTMSPRTRRFTFIITALIGFGAFYEIFFNFTIWGAIMTLTQCAPTFTTSTQCNPDSLASRFPTFTNPLNLVFATKVVTTVFALCVYSLWYLHRIERDIDRMSLDQDRR